MAREIYKEYYRMPTSNIIIVLILVHHWGVFPVAHGSWLFFGKLQGLPNTIGPRICDQMSLVPKQKEMCLEDPKVMMYVGEGTFSGIEECQFQFQNERWNCSTMERGKPVLGKVINRGSREASFVNAITTAGVMYSVIRACSRGDINSCSCDKRKHGDASDIIGHFTWGGCSDDIGNGTFFVREFVDAADIDVHDARAKMNLHNNNVGRRAVRKFAKRQCKCHGNTGSCTLRTCWEALGEFRQTGSYLKTKYDTAVHVTVTQNGANRDLVSSGKRSPPSKNDLVFLESSPDYCNRDTEIGTYGTVGRECNNSSSGGDGCEKLCCGRGYTTKTVTKIEDCMCEVHWCCEVKCDKCTLEREVHTCKGEDEFDIVSSSTTAATTTTLPHTSVSSTTKRQRKGRRGGKRKKGKGKRKGKGRKRKGGKSKTRNRREVSINPTHVHSKIQTFRGLSPTPLVRTGMR